MANIPEEASNSKVTEDVPQVEEKKLKPKKSKPKKNAVKKNEIIKKKFVQTPPTSILNELRQCKLTKDNEVIITSKDSVVESMERSLSEFLLPGEAKKTEEKKLNLIEGKVLEISYKIAVLWKRGDETDIILKKNEGESIDAVIKRFHPSIEFDEETPPVVEKEKKEEVKQERSVNFGKKEGLQVTISTKETVGDPDKKKNEQLKTRKPDQHIYKPPRHPKHFSKNKQAEAPKVDTPATKTSSNVNRKDIVMPTPNHSKHKPRNDVNKGSVNQQNFTGKGQYSNYRKMKFSSDKQQQDKSKNVESVSESSNNQQDNLSNKNDNRLEKIKNSHSENKKVEFPTKHSKEDTANDQKESKDNKNFDTRPQTGYNKKRTFQNRKQYQDGEKGETKNVQTDNRVLKSDQREEASKNLKSVLKIDLPVEQGADKKGEAGHLKENLSTNQTRVVSANNQNELRKRFDKSNQRRYYNDKKSHYPQNNKQYQNDIENKNGPRNRQNNTPPKSARESKDVFSNEQLNKDQNNKSPTRIHNPAYEETLPDSTQHQSQDQDEKEELSTNKLKSIVTEGEGGSKGEPKSNVIENSAERVEAEATIADSERNHPNHNKSDKSKKGNRRNKSKHRQQNQNFPEKKKATKDDHKDGGNSVKVKKEKDKVKGTAYYHVGFDVEGKYATKSLSTLSAQMVKSNLRDLISYDDFIKPEDWWLHLTTIQCENDETETKLIKVLERLDLKRFDYSNEVLDIEVRNGCVTTFLNSEEVFRSIKSSICNGCMEVGLKTMTAADSTPLIKIAVLNKSVNHEFIQSEIKRHWAHWNFQQVKFKKLLVIKSKDAAIVQKEKPMWYRSTNEEAPPIRKEHQPKYQGDGNDRKHKMSDDRYHEERGKRQRAHSDRSYETNWGHRGQQNFHEGTHAYNSRTFVNSSRNQNSHGYSAQRSWHEPANNMPPPPPQNDRQESQSFDDMVAASVGVDWNEEEFDVGGESWDYTISRVLTSILRHNSHGYKIDDEGFIPIDHILQYRKFKSMGVQSADIIRIVNRNDKQRFSLEEIEGSNGKYKIRANQGHTVEAKNLELVEINDPNMFPVLIHATSLDALPFIMETGIKVWKGRSIHLITEDPLNEWTPISGKRRSSNVLLHVNMEKCLKAGIKFSLTSNNVVISNGNKKGMIPVQYIDKVYQLKKDQKTLLYPKANSREASNRSNDAVNSS